MEMFFSVSQVLESWNLWQFWIGSWNGMVWRWVDVAGTCYIICCLKGQRIFLVDHKFFVDWKKFRSFCRKFWGCWTNDNSNSSDRTCVWSNVLRMKGGPRIWSNFRRWYGLELMYDFGSIVGLFHGWLDEDWCLGIDGVPFSWMLMYLTKYVVEEFVMRSFEIV